MRVPVARRLGVSVWQQLVETGTTRMPAATCTRPTSTERHHQRRQHHRHQQGTEHLAHLGLAGLLVALIVQRYPPAIARGRLAAEILLFDPTPI